MDHNIRFTEMQFNFQPVKIMTNDNKTNCCYNTGTIFKYLLNGTLIFMFK